MSASATSSSGGALVAEIDPTLLASRVGATRATLENLHAQLAERRAQQRLAEQQDKRNRMLFKAGAASEEVVQQSAAAVEQLASQRAALQAQIQQMQSQLDGDEANLRYTKIHAPMTGTVVSLTAREGQTLVASQQAPIILRVADLKTVTVWAQVSEADVPKIALGMPVYFNTLGQPERRWHGKVRQVLPTPETVNNVILYNVLFDVANPDQALKPQMSAQSYFVLAKATGALLVPTAALQPAGRKGGGKKSKQSDPDALAASTEGERRYSVRVLQEGVVAEREVTVGAMTRVSAQVLSGLARGEQVIVGTEPEKSKDKAKPRARLGRP